MTGLVVVVLVVLGAFLLALLASWIRWERER
jgi:hypothetical protein